MNSRLSRHRVAASFPNNKEQPPKDIIEAELLLIRSVEAGSFRRRLRVVQFTVNGVINSPKIDNRLYRKNDENPHGRTVSLDYDDAEAIVKNWAKIRECWFGK